MCSGVVGGGWYQGDVYSNRYVICKDVCYMLYGSIVNSNSFVSE